MSKSTQRRFEALKYRTETKAKLTTKQYLVYSFLISISKWNPDEYDKHYYVYKNSFVIKNTCELLGISQPTWRAAITKLKDEFYLQDYGKYYTIRVPSSAAQLEIRLIKYLLPFAAKLCSEGGGNIISVYSLIYKYWSECQKNGEECKITINQLKNIFVSRRTKELTTTYRLMLSIFKSSGLIDMKEKIETHNGLSYRVYIINNVKNDIIYDEDLDENAPDNVEHILNLIGDDIIEDIEIIN